MTQLFGLEKASASYYRKLYIAYLIETGINTIPKIIETTGWVKLAILQSIKGLSNYDIEIEHVGARKNGNFIVTSWSPILTKESIMENSEFLTAKAQLIK